MMTGEYASPEALRYGFPAVSGHEVVALSCISRRDWGSTEPGHICVIRWRHEGVTSQRVPSERLHVWARAGRVSFVSPTGEQVNLTLLGEHEYENLHLGAPWPTTHKAGKAANAVQGAAHDVKNAITFPASFPRMMRTSGERNAVTDAVVAWCAREMPAMHVLRGWPRGAEGPTADQLPALPHKGLIGDHGWLEVPPGAAPVERNQH